MSRTYLDYALPVPSDWLIASDALLRQEPDEEEEEEEGDDEEDDDQSDEGYSE
jgi:hypothetical protein